MKKLLVILICVENKLQVPVGKKYLSSKESMSWLVGKFLYSLNNALGDLKAAEI